MYYDIDMHVFTPTMWRGYNAGRAPMASSLSKVLSISTKYDSSRFSTASSAAASASSLASMAASPSSAHRDKHMTLEVWQQAVAHGDYDPFTAFIGIDGRAQPTIMVF